MAVGVVITALVLHLNGDFSARDVVRGIADREAGVLNFSYHTRTDEWSEGDDLSASPRGHHEMTVVGDASGRFRLEGFEETRGRAPGEPSITLKQLQIFDGQTQHDAFGNGAFTHGHLRGTRAPFLLPVDPALFVTHFNQVPVGKYLQNCEEKNSHATLVTGTTDFDGRSVLVVETFAHEAGGKFWKSQFYVDAERAFSVVRKSALIRDTGSDDWRTNYVCELKDNFEAAPGIWVPRRAISTLFQKLAGKPSHIFTHAIARIDDWVINAQMAESTFDFSFPPNVFVTDELTGTSYMTGLVNDRLVAARSDEAMRMASRRYTWVAVAVSIGLFAVLVLAVRASRARSAS